MNLVLIYNREESGGIPSLSQLNYFFPYNLPDSFLSQLLLFLSIYILRLFL